MARVVWPDDTIDKLDRIIAYIDVFDPSAATRLHRKLTDLGNSLADFPSRGRPAANDTRELVTVPPYVLRYGVEGEDVIILDIRHGARNPD